MARPKIDQLTIQSTRAVKVPPLQIPTEPTNSLATMEAPRKSRRSKKDKKSGVRTKFLIESLRNDYQELRQENERLREMVKAQLPPSAANAILAECFDANGVQKADPNNIDELAGKMSGADITDDEDD